MIIALCVLGALVINTGGTEITIDIHLVVPYGVRVFSIILALVALIIGVEDIDLLERVRNGRNDQTNSP